MTRYLTVDELRQIAELALPTVSFRDIGQLHAAAQRLQATAFQEEAYPDVWQKAAALMQSIVIGYPLADGNKRLAWLSTDAFLSLNGVDFDYTDEDAAYDLVIAVTTGDPADVPEIAERLRKLSDSHE